MKKVDISTLLPGSIAQENYYTERGELLLSKDLVVTEKHLDMIRRRNICDLYTKLSGEEEELERLLAVDVGCLGKLDLAETRVARTPAQPRSAVRWHEPQALSLPALKDISVGKDGLAALLESQISTSLDNSFSARSSDRPVGPALAERAKQIDVAERTKQYKRDINASYRRGLEDTTRILNHLADGHKIGGVEIHDVVKRFVKIFITDRNILLNISGRKHQGDNYLYHHSLNVCLLAINIAASEGYSEQQVIEIGMGALLHDIGMFLIPSSIVTKPGRLTQEEWYEVQKHPILALHLLERIRNMPESVPFVSYQTHERENKAGYPKRRGTHLIHRFAKIVQIADIYEAMSSPRSYRPAYIPYKSVENLIKMSRQGLISGGFVEAFLRYASLFPVGSLVTLNDTRVGKVVQANSLSFAKPVVSVLTDENGAVLEKSRIVQVDLSINSNTYITRALPLDFLPGVDLMDGF